MIHLEARDCISLALLGILNTWVTSTGLLGHMGRVLRAGITSGILSIGKGYDQMVSCIGVTS